MFLQGLEYLDFFAVSVKEIHKHIFFPLLVHWAPRWFSHAEFCFLADMCNLVSFNRPIIFVLPSLINSFFQHHSECQSLTVATHGKYDL